MAGKQKIHESQRNHAKRDRHQQASGGKPHRAQRVRAVHPHGDHREHYHAGESQMRPQPFGERPRIDVDLTGSQTPANFVGSDKQADVDQPQQYHRMGYVMFEQANHRRVEPPAKPHCCCEGPALGQRRKMSVKLTVQALHVCIEPVREPRGRANKCRTGLQPERRRGSGAPGPTRTGTSFDKRF